MLHLYPTKNRGKEIIIKNFEVRNFAFFTIKSFDLEDNVT